jgi:branched-chain amino acid transport system substrate-binding protein
MRYRIYLLGILILFGIVLFFGNLSGYFSLKSENNDYYKLGVVIPMTGVLSNYGDFQKNAIEMAIDEINENNYLDKSLKVYFQDTQSNSKDAIMAFEKLINFNNVPLVLLTPSSPAVIAMAPIAENKKVPVIAMGAAANDVRYAGEYIFRVKNSADVEMESFVYQIYDVFKKRNIYILYLNNDYGKSIKESTEFYFKKLGGNIIGSESYEVNEKDYSTMLLKINESNADAIFIVGWAKNTGQILRQAKELNINHQFFAPVGSIGPEVISIGKEASENLIYSVEFNIDSDDFKVREFIINYESKFGIKPDLFAAMAYDSIYLSYEVFKICNNDSECIKDKLYEIEHSGISGDINFDEYGDVSKEMYLMTIRNGEFVSFD